MDPVLVLKLVLVPLLIGGVTLAARRWGPAVGGWLSAFPVITAPILLFVAGQQGVAFAAEATVGTLAAVLANVVFGLGYAWTAVRFPWVLALVAAFVGYFLAVAVVVAWSPSLWVAIPAVAVTLLLAQRWYPEPVASAQVERARNDIFWRMGAGGVLVLAVTSFSATLGARLSGAFAMFPVMASVLAVFSHRQAGPASAVRLLQGMLMGYYAFSTFCIVLALALPSLGIGAAFFLALGGAVIAQLLTRMPLLRAERARNRRTAPQPTPVSTPP